MENCKVHWSQCLWVFSITKFWDNSALQRLHFLDKQRISADLNYQMLTLVIPKSKHKASCAGLYRHCGHEWWFCWRSAGYIHLRRASCFWKLNRELLTMSLLKIISLLQAHLPFSPVTEFISFQTYPEGRFVLKVDSTHIINNTVPFSFL